MANLRYLIYVVLCSSFVAYVLSQTCAEQTSCSDCATLNGCGWCAPTQQCLPGTPQGPNNGTCLGEAWEWMRCTPCSSFSDCRSCLVYDSDCFWCQSANDGNGACKPVGFVGCPYTHTCPCSNYGGCSACVDDPNCAWCDESLVCVNGTTQCLPNEQRYNFTTSCPCPTNTNCQSCKETSGCRWCMSGECIKNTIQCDGPAASTCQSYCESSATNCEECTAMPGCAWCAESNSCVNPSTSSCVYTQQCAKCDFAVSCDACMTSPFCTWCEDSGTCALKGQTNCLMAHTCEDYCKKFGSCDTCNKIRGCGWCDDKSECADVNNAACFFAHTCAPGPNPAKCGFDSASFVGGMFLVTGILIICVVAYVFYRWKTTGRTHYTELK